MEGFHLDWHSPKSIILGADGHFVPIRHEVDQVWSLCFEPSETQLFYLQTTYGLRARSMRIFPNLLIDGKRLTHLNDFIKLPTITRYTPGSLRIEYETIQGLQVVFTCFLPEMDIIVGDLRIHNVSDETIGGSVEMAAILLPMHQGTPSKPQKIHNCTIIHGQTGTLSPVFLMSGGPSALTNPYPALSLSMEFFPDQSNVINWSMVTKDTLEASFKTAQNVISTPWQKKARNQQKFHAAHTILIQTGDPGWDAALYLSQVIAQTHCNKHLSKEEGGLCYLESRLPDQVSAENKPVHFTLLDATHLAEVLLPAHYDTFKSLVESFVSRIDQNGLLQTRFSHIGSTRSLKELPLLAQLCLDLYEIRQDQTFLRRNFSHLCRYFDHWLISDTFNHDHVCLTWQDPQQLQLNTGMFNFDIWDPTGQGLNIQTVESPALAAMLYREALSLQKIASILDETDPQQKYQKLALSLKKRLADFWQENQKGFSYLDHQTHLKSQRELYYPRPAHEILELKKVFTRPQRLQLHLTSKNDNTCACLIIFTGKDKNGEILTEKFSPKNIRWVAGHAHLTTNQLFTVIETVTIQGLQSQDKILLETADFAQPDITCLAPVWSGGMGKDQLRSMIKHHFNWNKTGLEYGIPETWEYHEGLPEDLTIFINLLWNTLLIKGLAAQGYQKQAMHLFQNLMVTIIAGLRHHQGFFPFFNQRNGLPAGTSHGINSLVPLRLFLQIAGIRLFTPERVAIWGTNPFPWPIEITWQGLSLHRDGSKTHIIFPDGSTYHTDSLKPIILTASGGRA